MNITLNEVIFYRLEFTDVLYKPDNGLGLWVVWYPMDEDASTNEIGTWVVAVV